MLLIAADGSGGTAAGAPWVAGVATWTPVQKLIKAVLNYNDPIRSVAGIDLLPHYAATDTMPSHSDNNYRCGLVRFLHRGGTTGNEVDPS